MAVAAPGCAGTLEPLARTLVQCASAWPPGAADAVARSAVASRRCSLALGQVLSAWRPPWPRRWKTRRLRPAAAELAAPGAAGTQHLALCVAWACVAAVPVGLRQCRLTAGGAWPWRWRYSWWCGDSAVVCPDPVRCIAWCGRGRRRCAWGCRSGRCLRASAATGRARAAPPLPATVVV